VYLRDFEPGNHVLQQADGTVLFVSAIYPDIPAVDLGGAIMGATSATAVTGAGLLGRFYFTTLEAFAGEAQFTVSHVSLKTLSGVTRLEPGLVATVSDLAEQVFPEGPVSIDFNRAAGNQDQRRGGSATPGSRYPMELWVSSAPEINGWGVTIEYDPTQVTFVSGSFEASDYLPGIFALAEEGTGWVIPGGSVLASDVTASGDGMLGTLEFEVLSGFTDSTDLVISQVQLKHVDTGEEIIPVHYVATITASRASGLVGDFNGDGRVNLSDFFVFADAFGTRALAKLLAVAEVYLGVPLRAQLAQNYPNPFNSDTVIEYQLPQPGEMQLGVYDLAGQRVTTLASGSRAAGSYSVAWDGSGDDSQPVASGVYLYRLQTSEGVAVRKLILIR
jgi:hypothetical protein